MASELVHVDIDGFFVSVERARDPALAARPVVIGGRRGSRALVAAASDEARERGIAPGMSIAEAECRCPGAVFLEGRFDAYLEASAELDAIIRRHAEIVEWTSVDEAYVDLGPQRPRGEGLRTADRIREEIGIERGLHASCGIARTKTVARIASRIARPRGLLYVLPGYEARFLAPLAVDLLPGIDAATARRLHAARVHTLGQLAALDATAGAMLLGSAATVLARHAAGLETSRVMGSSLPRLVSRDVTFAAAITDVGAIERALDDIARLAAGDLRRRSLLARTVTVRMTEPGGTVRTRSFTLRDAASRDSELLSAARALLSVLSPSSASVHRLAVSLSGLVRVSRHAPLLSMSGGSTVLDAAPPASSSSSSEATGDNGPPRRRRA